MVDDTKDEEMIYGLTADERDELQHGLHGLGETMPPRIVWERIREQADAEGLIRRKPLQRPSTWYAGSGIAAALLLAVLIVPSLNEEEPQSFPTEPPNTVADTTQATVLQTLMVESRQLENDLRSLPAEPRVVRAGMAATIAEIEDRIAAIDYQLNDPSYRLSPEEEEIFWRERVRLMKSLIRLRYAQAQRTAF